GCPPRVSLRLSLNDAFGSRRRALRCDALAFVGDDRSNNRNELVSFLDEGLRLRGCCFHPPLADAHARPRLPAFFQPDRAFRDEVGIALGGARLLEHRGERQAAIEQLRHHQAADAAALRQLLAEADDLARIVERAVADILSVFVRRRSESTSVVRHGAVASTRNATAFPAEILRVSN